jgi:AcrR family transcriptional regulator
MLKSAAAEAPEPEVRTRILEAAWRLIGERQNASVSLLDIARAAGVSRQTVYVNFNNRAGLLLAMVEHSDARSADLARLQRQRAEQSVDQAIETTIRGWFKYLPVVFDVAHALRAAAVTDADARLAWDSRMALLRGGLLGLMQRLQAEGRLAAGWTPDTAADWCHHLVHIDTWHHLVVQRHWRPADVVRRTLATVRASVVRPETAPPP